MNGGFQKFFGKKVLISSCVDTISRLQILGAQKAEGRLKGAVHAGRGLILFRLLLRLMVLPRYFTRCGDDMRAGFDAEQGDGIRGVAGLRL